MSYLTKRRITFITIFMFTIFILLISSMSQKAYGEIREIRVDRDASVYEFSPNTNCGNDTRLRVGNYHSEKVRTYYHFNISSLPNGWTEAKILVHFDYGSSMVYVGANVTYDSWDEMTITWNNKPSGGKYRGSIHCDGFDFNIPLTPENITNDEVTVCLYGKGGESDGFIQGYSKEGASSKDDVPIIKLTYDDNLDPIFFTVLIVVFVLVLIIMVGVVSYFSINTSFKKRKKKYDAFQYAARPRILEKRPIPLEKILRLQKIPLEERLRLPTRPAPLKKKINQYITLKMENGRTYIYVNGKRFLQCIRLILNIPKIDIELYEEVDSIDEAAKLYSQHLFQNRILRRPMDLHPPNQKHDITPKQEFWGHCSNIQAWVEHDYDTRILMSNISFPLLRELTRAGDPLAKKIFKEEIALRLESGYPSVVQYLIAQGYIRYFSPSELHTIIVTSELIENLSSDPRMLFNFLMTCIIRFPTLLKDMLLKILKLPEGKETLISSFSIKSRSSYINLHLKFNPIYLSGLKIVLEDFLGQVDVEMIEAILDCINSIDKLTEEFDFGITNILARSPTQLMRRFMLNYMPINIFDDARHEERVQFHQRILDALRRSSSKCHYCRKVIPKGQEICEWCGHKRDDNDDNGFFPYPYIFKPPGGGGGLNKEAIAIPVRN